MKPIDIAGQKYGRLIALERAKNDGRRTVWLFRCDCGAIKEIDLDPVRRGKVLSCGCFRDEVTALRSITHGHSTGKKESRELKSYNSAKSRCCNPNDKKFLQYGARGITMCARWMEDASTFIEDMGPRPLGHSIDRIDPNGNYEPLNCRWANSHQQARTRTDNVLVEFQGVTIVLKDYASLTGVNYKSLHRKFRREGMSLEQATAELSPLGR